MKSYLEDNKRQITDFGKIFVDSYNGTEQMPQIDKNIVICGMGGSSIAGDYINTLGQKFNSTRQVLVWKDYNLPPYLTRDWFAVVISYSGNTEETISLTLELLKKQIKFVVITSGGKLKAIAKDNQIKLFLLQEGFQPRYALPMILGKILKILSTSLGIPNLTDNQKDQLRSNWNPSDYPNWEKLLKACKSKQIFLLSDRLLQPIALRFRCQLNENSKLTASTYVVPEFNHNGIVGFEPSDKPSDSPSNYVGILIFNHLDKHPRAGLQEEYTQNFLKENGMEIYKLENQSDDFILNILLITRILDLLSYEIAISMGIDPINVESISQLKATLKEN